MPLEISPVEEKDLHAFADIHASAFGPSAVFHASHPNGMTKAVRDEIAGIYTRAFAEPDTTCLKVIDTDDQDRIVAWLHWMTIQGDKKVSKHSNKLPLPSTPDINRDVLAAFHGGVAEVGQKIYQGRTHVHVGILITHADYQKRGIGTMLMNRCIEHADNVKLPTITGASPDGAPLYRKLGFVQPENAVAILDLKPFGKDVRYPTVIMERPVKT